MNLSKEQIDFINKNEWVIMATVDKNLQPRASIVMPSYVEPERIIISNMQMGQTAKNIHENKNVFISSYDKDMNECLKIKGVATIENAGKLFDEIKAIEATRCEFTPKEIIIVKITNIESVVENT